MTQEEFNSINWKRGNRVRLDNGKDYLLKGMTHNGKLLVLYSEEYRKYFIANYIIIDCRTSDYAEPEEVTLRHMAEKRAANIARHQAMMEELYRLKVERKEKRLKEQEEARAKRK